MTHYTSKPAAARATDNLRSIRNSFLLPGRRLPKVLKCTVLSFRSNATVNSVESRRAISAKPQTSALRAVQRKVWIMIDSRFDGPEGRMNRSSEGQRNNSRGKLIKKIIERAIGATSEDRHCNLMTVGAAQVRLHTVQSGMSFSFNPEVEPDRMIVAIYDKDQSAHFLYGVTREGCLTVGKPSKKGLESCRIQVSLGMVGGRVPLAVAEIPEVLVSASSIEHRDQLFDAIEEMSAEQLAQVVKPEDAAAVARFVLGDNNAVGDDLEMPEPTGSKSMVAAMAEA
jgi:hypothetical protein